MPDSDHIDMRNGPTPSLGEALRRYRASMQRAGRSQGRFSFESPAWSGLYREDTVNACISEGTYEFIGTEPEDL